MQIIKECKITEKHVPVIRKYNGMKYRFRRIKRSIYLSKKIKKTI